jgi:thiamine biosynthesis lipoprotein
MPSPLPENRKACEPAVEVIRARPLLGTLVQIHATGPQARIHSAIDDAFAAVEHVQQLMSYHDPGSELSMLNREAALRSIRVHPDTYVVLASALRFARMSDGAFDPCVGRELEHWGYLPSHGAAGDFGADRDGDWRDVELLPEREVRFRRSLRLDLGGIAKGYAIDLAVRALQDGGASDVLVNAGGDLRVWGEHTRSIPLRHPMVPAAAVHAVPLRNAALATSAAYYSRRQLASGEASALVHPRTRAPYIGAHSVSVRAPDCLSADALTKVVLFASPGIAERALSKCNAEAYVQQAQLGGRSDSSAQVAPEAGMGVHAR